MQFTSLSLLILGLAATVVATPIGQPQSATPTVNTGNYCPGGYVYNVCCNGGLLNCAFAQGVCTGGDVYCCQSNPMQNGVFNSNSGNCVLNQSTSSASGGSGSGSAANKGLLEDLLGGVGGTLDKTLGTTGSSTTSSGSGSGSGSGLVSTLGLGSL
ncbi:hypothetical protein V5O48_015110 [Marasmius crinis-equi]|uniref:Uncharacterized protein n=1 Tax=Marasmius crinis-equi TaxID=585013 RepID=A0ABR3EVE9_9AGAR